AGVLDLHEVGHYEMRARADEHLGRVAEVPRVPAAPGPAVDEEVDRRVRALGDVDVELLDLAWAVRRAPRRAKALARELVVGRVAGVDLVAVRGVDRLVVGVVELCLVHFEPHAWPLGARRLGRTVLRTSRARHRSRGGEGSEKRPSGRGHG